MTDRHPALLRLVEQRLDPTSRPEVVVAALRRAGFAGDDGEALRLAVAYRVTPEAWYPEIDPRLTMSPVEAARVLCRTRQRVHQLIDECRLLARRRADQTLAVDPDSVLTVIDGREQP